MNNQIQVEKKQYKVIGRGADGTVVELTNSETEAEQKFAEVGAPKYLYNREEMEQFDSGLLNDEVG
jgi:hypothetical protein